MTARPARGGGRWVDVDAQRLRRFLDQFADRHGEVVVDADVDTVRIGAADGAVATCEVPFPPLAVDAAAPYAGLVGHAERARRIGVVLVRRGGFAAGIFDGSQLTVSKVGSRHVQGRSAAGGWSQQRFARRRQGQARQALDAAADTAAALLLPERETLDAVVVGGDRGSCDNVLRDPRLAPLAPLVQARRLDVPDPRLRVLQQCAAQIRAVRVRLDDPVPK
jgi:hypothetical protein